MNQNKVDRIIRRVNKLLALAEDNSSVEESQTAFLQAQQMMVKYGVDPSDLDISEESKRVLEKSGSDYKRLFWWERRLASIVAKNFRCKNYINNKYIEGKKQVQRRIMFMGRDEDVNLAREMYKLAREATLFYTKCYMQQNDLKGSSVKNDYILGFVDGLEEKFEDQINSQSQEWGLVLVVPKNVEERYKKEVTGTLYHKIPDVNSDEHYSEGYEDGNAIDYTKSTVKGGEAI